MEVDLERLQECIKDSNKSKRVEPYFGEVLLFLCSRVVGKSALKEKDEHVGATIMIAMEKATKYLKTPGKMITKGMAPLQTMKYIHQLVHFSFLEHQSFVYGKDNRILKGKELDTVAFDADYHEMFNSDEPVFDIVGDFKQELEYERSLINTDLADDSVFNI